MIKSLAKVLFAEFAQFLYADRTTNSVLLESPCDLKILYAFLKLFEADRYWEKELALLHNLLPLSSETYPKQLKLGIPL